MRAPRRHWPDSQSRRMCRAARARAVRSSGDSPRFRVTVVDGVVELFELTSKPCGVPTRESACARCDLSDRDEARGSIRSGFTVWHEVCDGHAVSRNRKAFTLLHATHDRAALVAQFPLTNRCRHQAMVAQMCYAL